MDKIATPPMVPNREPARVRHDETAPTGGTPEGAEASSGLRGICCLAGARYWRETGANGGDHPGECLVAKPVVRWAGGKSHLAPLVTGAFRSYLEFTGGNYVEPFLGGGAIALALAHHRVMYLSDACAPLVRMFKSVVANPERVYAEMREIASRGVDEETYFAERRRPLTPGRFLYVNHLSWNGLYRENRSGQYNVPFGDRGEDPFPTLDQLRAVALAFRYAEIQTWDFRRALRHVPPGSLVFSDPPYAGGFAEYTRSGFTDDDQQRLASMLENLARTGVVVVACNADTSAVRAWYSWVPEIVSTGELRAINRDGEARSKKAECLLMTTHADLLAGLA